MTYAEKLIDDFKKIQASEFGPPPFGGVYGVYIRNYFGRAAEHLLYIGSSQNVNKRVSTSKHPYRKLLCRYDKRDVLVYTKTLCIEDFCEAEKILIGHFRPIFNIQHNQ